jgi:hypothetical protein
VTQFYSWRRNSSRIVDLTVLDRFGYQDADKNNKIVLLLKWKYNYFIRCKAKNLGRHLHNLFEI